MGASDGREGQIEIQESLSGSPLAAWAVLGILFAVFLAIGIVGGMVAALLILAGPSGRLLPSAQCASRL